MNKMRHIFTIIETYENDKDPENPKVKSVISKLNIDIKDISSTKEVINLKNNKPYKSRCLINLPYGTFMVKDNFDNVNNLIKAVEDRPYKYTKIIGFYDK